MKGLAILIMCVFSVLFSEGQKNYADAIKQGDKAFEEAKYKEAINKYFAAEAFDPSKKDAVKAKVNMAFEKIEALRDEAVKSFEATKKAQEAMQHAIVASHHATQARMEAEQQRVLSQQALHEEKSAKEKEHDALVKSIAQLNNIQIVQDSLKKEINNLIGIEKAAKESLIAILESGQNFTMAVSFSDQKIISDYVISNEGKKMPKVYEVGDHKYIGVNFPMDQSFSRAKIEALGISFDDVMEGKLSLTETQIDILFESDLGPVLKYTKALFPGLASISPNRQAALVDMVYNIGTGILKNKLDIVNEVNAGDWKLAADKIRAYVENKIAEGGIYQKVPGIAKRLKQNADILENDVLPQRK